MSNNKREKPIDKNLFLHRGLVVLAAVAGWTALQWTFLSTADPSYMETTKKYVAQNIGMGGLIAYIVILLALAPRYSLYWAVLSKPEKLKADERLRALRSRVYEGSYSLFAIISVCAIVMFNNGDGRMQLILAWFVGVSYFGLPILLAAWQKDS